MKFKENTSTAVKLFQFFSRMIVIVTIVVIPGCFSDETATLKINFGNHLPENSRAAAPSNISGVTITVQGADMETIIKNYSTGVNSVSLEVPPGSGRIIEVSAAVDPSDPGVVLSYRGSDQVDLAEGETRTVILQMQISETKILIPDYLNNRLVQISSMSGGDAIINSTWTELSGTAAGFASDIDFRPFDVDIDSQGRIFIANAYGGSGMGNNRVVRVDNISGSNVLSFAEASYDGSVVAIAVDRKNNLVYYATNSGIATEKLYRSNLDNSTYTYLDISVGVEAIDRIEGMSVDPDGILYIAGAIATGQPKIFKYNPSTETVTHSYSANLSASNGPMDVMVKNGFVYVANPEGADGFRILQLSADFASLVDSYGIGSGAIDTVGQFYGAERFVGTINPYFYIIDEDFGGGSPDRLIYIEDFNGTGWKTYGQSGSVSPGFFNFYSMGI